MKKNKNSKQFLRNFPWLFILLCMNTVGVFAQIKVSGSITYSNKDPLIGVNIKVEEKKPEQFPIRMVNILFKCRMLHRH